MDMINVQFTVKNDVWADACIQAMAVFIVILGAPMQVPSTGGLFGFLVPTH